MNKIIFLFVVLFTSSFAVKLSPSTYDAGYVTIQNMTFSSKKFAIVSMKREGERIKAKYFSAPLNGKSVYQRYNDWSSGKNIVLYSSGTYMNDTYTPTGLNIDNGTLVNNSLSDKMDGLVIVYATGGIVVSNIKEGNLKVKYGTRDTIFNLNNDWDLEGFIDWAKSNSATVFQTHLLVYKNVLKINPYSSNQTPRERRFLAVCTDSLGKLFHIIINTPDYSTLYDGTQQVFNYLKNVRQMKQIVYMINLDTGYQDVFKLFNSDGTVNESIEGKVDLSVAVNLLVYYFQ